MLKEKEDAMKTVTNNIGDTMAQVNELIRMKQVNGDLQKRVEYLQKRERDLLDTLVKNKGTKRPSDASLKSKPSEQEY
jgi:tRNA uridine 5-carbamoylmethylation protein Kti12